MEAACAFTCRHSVVGIATTMEAATEELHADQGEEEHNAQGEDAQEEQWH